MSNSKQLFRKAALERLSSPEQLDTLMQITSPVGWVALLALFIILVVIVLWGIFGTIPDKIEGNGILLRGGKVLGLTSGTAGQVTQILVKSGDTVVKGQEVARISQSDLLRQIQNIEDQLKETEGRHTKQAEALKKNVTGSIQALNKERQSLRAAIEDFKRQIKALEKTVRKQKRLVSKGLLTELKLLNTQNALAAAEQSKSQRGVRLAQIDSQEEGHNQQLEETKRTHETEVADLKRELEDRKSKLEATSRVVSPHSGRVLEIMVAVGNMVHQGTDMLTMEKLDTMLEAVFFVPAFHGKKVKVGMSVHISPSTVKAEEHGSIIGKVHSVSVFPITPEGMLQDLQSQTLVRDLTGNRAHFRVVATLVTDETTPSGYKWSSSKGPPSDIHSGTVATALVVVGEKRPISYVIPLFRKSLAL